MNKNIICLFLMSYIINSKTEYTFEIIEELIPKRILFDHFETTLYKILKYNLICDENINSKTANIYLQFYSFNSYTFDIYLYDNFSEIKQNEFTEYLFMGAIQERRYVNIGHALFRNLTCKKDYYFIISYPHFNPITINELYTRYCEILIFKEETNINLSPLLSEHYRIYPRKKEDNIFFSFNCTMFAYLDCSNFKIIENEKIIDVKYIKINIYEFKKDRKYNIIFSEEINIYFYAQFQFIKFDINKFPIIIYPQLTIIKKYILEIDISNYELNEYILLKYVGYLTINLKYQFKNELKHNNFIELGTFYNNMYWKCFYIPIKISKKDSSLLLYIRQIDVYSPHIGIIYISKFKACEITSDYNENFKGPKLFFIDYNKFNNLKSFGIESNHNYFF